MGALSQVLRMTGKGCGDIVRSRNRKDLQKEAASNYRLMSRIVHPDKAPLGVPASDEAFKVLNSAKEMADDFYGDRRCAPVTPHAAAALCGRDAARTYGKLNVFSCSSPSGIPTSRLHGLR